MPRLDVVALSRALYDSTLGDAAAAANAARASEAEASVRRPRRRRRRPVEEALTEYETAMTQRTATKVGQLSHDAMMTPWCLSLMALR